MFFKKLFRRRKFKDVLYEWLANKKNYIKETSYIKYLYRIEKYIVPNMGDIKFKKINCKNIDDFFKSEKINKLSDSTKNCLLIIIKSCINYGIEKKYRRTSIKLKVKFKRKQNEITYFTVKEQEIIEKYIKYNLNISSVAVLLSLYTGMRIGEICGLKGTDIDFVSKNISVRRTVQRISNIDGTTKTKINIGKPKTLSSIRVIPTPSFIIDILEDFIKDKNNYILTGTDKPKDPRALEKYFKKMLIDLGLKPLNYHALRHTYATRLREKKVDIKIISILLGHSNWKITQDTYVHASLDSIKESVNNLRAYIKK